MLALTPVHKPTRRHSILTKFGGIKEAVLTPAGHRSRLAVPPWCKDTKAQALCNRSNFSKEGRQASSSSLAPEALKHFPKADLSLQAVVDSSGAAFLVWDGFSGVPDSTLLEHEGRSAS